VNGRGLNDEGQPTEMKALERMHRSGEDKDASQKKKKKSK